MGEYEEVKAQAGPLLIESKKIEGLVAAHQYDVANNAIFELLNKVLAIYDKFPHTLAAYVISSNVIQSMTRSAETLVNENSAAPQLPLLLSHINFAQSTDFLLRAPENPNCANLLLSAALHVYFTFMDYIPYIPNASENQDAMEYYTSVLQVVTALTNHFKSVIPDSPLISQAVSLCANIKEQGVTFRETCLTLEAVRNEKNRMESLIGKVLPTA